ncbi:MgtC/SapB family protein [Granulosicoccus sp. 3-233]|uniref:MgtC/SapB family protein n=1 Tax=Granulosicoccus sp. 3-233 TaxID=3417969 RepID=UPI003D3321FC
MLETLLSEFGTDQGLPMLVIAVRVAGAALFSGVIGLEREIRKDTAGLRTHMLIGTAAAVFAVITIELMLLAQGDYGALRLDPLRLVEAVTGGVAFLAAGIVVYTKGNVKGLTTGAGMWLAASIGLACGLGYWSIALIACVAGIIVIGLLRHVEVACGSKELAGKSVTGSQSSSE